MFRNTHLILIVFALFCSHTLKAQDEKNRKNYRDIYPDTWVATDALGRTMPENKDVGELKNDKRRVTGIFYITWHSDHLHNMKNPYRADVSKILKEDPDARFEGDNPLWTESQYHWGEPELGYFLSKDEYVIRKDMSMLADAGIDVVIFDVTNAVHYWSEWESVIGVMQKMRQEGNKVPQICFWAFNGPVITVVQDLYEKIYKKDKYRDLWFYWDGKPLLLYNGNPAMDANGGGVANPNPNYDPDAKTNTMNPHYGDPDYTEEFYKDYTNAVKEFFTLRTMWWGYYEWAGERFVGQEDKWSFGYELCDKRVLDLPLENLLSTHRGIREQGAVTTGQHAISAVGKSWTREKGQPELDQYDMPVPTYVPWLGETVENPTGYGIYFQERWDEILSVDPEFLYINDWNEWTAGKYKSGLDPSGQHEGPTEFLGKKNPFYFVDQYNAEFNRTIQPMKGGYSDNFYMQMAQNIRKYKGARPIPEHKGFSSISIDGLFEDWNSIEIEYRDTKGDTEHRDYNGYGGLHYVNTSGRNDILTSKVAIDENNLYFYVETSDEMTSHTDNNWMLLLIDADNNSSTGWYGYDYIINKAVSDERSTSLMRYNEKSKKWSKASSVNYRKSGNKLEVVILRKSLKLNNKEHIVFDFKWSDNPENLDDPISLIINGDTAPNRRFNYRFIWDK